MNQAAHSALLSVPAFVHHGTTALGSFPVASCSVGLDSNFGSFLPDFKSGSRAEMSEWMQRKDVKKEAKKTRAIIEMALSAIR